MKNIIYLFIQIILYAFFLQSCLEFNHQSEKLPGNYTYQDKGMGYRTIHPTNIFNKNKIYADVTDFAFDNNYILIEQCPNISNYRSDLGFDLYFRYVAYSDYLKDPNNFKLKESYIANIIKADSVNYKIFLSLGASEKNSLNDINIRTSIADSLIKNNIYLKSVFLNGKNYWIIIPSQDTMIGPLLKTEYLAKKIKLNVPLSLNLNFEKE